MSKNQPTAHETLFQLAQQQAVEIDLTKFKYEFGAEEWAIPEFLLAAKAAGLKARHFTCNVAELFTKPLPAAATDHQGNYFIILSLNKKIISSNDFTLGKEQTPRKSFSIATHNAENIENYEIQIQCAHQPPKTIAADELTEIWSGDLILVSNNTNNINEKKYSLNNICMKYSILFIEILLISFVLQALRVVVPVFFQILIDKVLPNQTRQTLDVMVLGLLFSVILIEGLKVIRQYLISEVSHKISIELDTKIHSHLLKAPSHYLSSNQNTHYSLKLKDLERIRKFYTESLPIICDNLFLVVLLFTLMHYDPIITSIAIIAILVCSLISWLYTLAFKRDLLNQENHRADNNAFFSEMVGGVRTIKATVSESRWQKRLEKKLASYLQLSFKIEISKLWLGFIRSLILKIVTIVIIFVAVTRVMDGALTTGAFIAVGILLYQIFSQFESLNTRLGQYIKFSIALDNIKKYFNIKPETSSEQIPLSDIKGLVEFERTTFRYKPDSLDVLRNIELTILPGETIGIIGETGAGKSTISELLLRNYKVTQGRILIDGHDVNSIDLFSLRRQVSVVSPSSKLFNSTVRENICTSNPLLSVDEMIEAAIAAGAHDFICKLPEGYDTIIQDSGLNLSSSERLLIILASVLVSNPRIIIFDNFFAELTSIASQNIYKNLRNNFKNRTIIILTQSPHLIRNVDRIAVIQGGEITEIGTHDELSLISKGIYASLYLNQNSKNLELKNDHKERIGSELTLLSKFL
jgi:subfamily B ATP-binding cassette protein HlyB/CyaB